MMSVVPRTPGVVGSEFFGLIIERLYHLDLVFCPVVLLSDLM